MGKHHWKIEKQPEWYVKAVRKTIAALPGGYAEAADWLDVTENALFNRRLYPLYSGHGLFGDPCSLGRRGKAAYFGGA